MMSMTRRALARLILGAAIVCGCVPFVETTPSGSTSSVGIVVDAAALSVAEGGTAALGLRLSDNPGRPVVVTAKLSGAAGPFSITEGASLSFGVSDWDTPKIIRVLASADANTTHETGTLRIEVDGRFYLGVALTEVDAGSTTPPPAEPPPVEEPPAPAPVPAPPTPVPPVPPVDPGEPQEGVTLSVKDASGIGVIDYPVMAIIPVSFGVYQDTSRFRIVDGQGNAIPAQFEALNRWVGRDNSIRHVAAHFQASVGAANKAFYAFQTNKGAGPAPQKPVKVTDASGVVTVDTGAVRFTLKKSGFNLFDEVWLDTNGDGSYAASERIVAPSTDVGAVLTDRNGAKQRANDRTDLRVVIEESGPMRSVIRVSSLSKFFSASDHRHGFAMRIYAYAGKSFVKVDYQLQNSAKNARYSAPLYFDEVALSLRPALSSPTARFAAGAGNVWSGGVSNGRYLFQNSLTASTVNATGGSTLLSGTNPAAEASCGWGDLSDGQRGVFMTVRHMAEMWPNALEVAPDNTMAIGLWPKYGAQYHAGQINGSGLYWLEDMQQVYKESLIYFHGANVASTELDRLAKTFQYHPVPFVPIAEYARTKVTLDLGGIVPITTPVGGTDTRRILFTPSYYKDAAITQGNERYNFGWMNFLGDVARKRPGGAGGIFYSACRVIATERVDEWLTAEGAAIGELNCRPQWIAEYKYPEDYALLQPSQDPYGSRSWRGHVTGSEPDLPNVVDYLGGTGHGGWSPRDNQHGWFGHVEDFYWVSGNPWIRDWYDFIGEFRKTERSNPGLSNWSVLSVQGWESVRGEAHSFSNAMQALRVTGNKSILEWARMRLDNFRSRFDPEYGMFMSGGDWDNKGSVFEHGYLGKSLSQLYEEVEGHDREIQDRVFHFLWGVVAWNDGHATFGYHVTNRNPTSYPYSSAGSALVMGDIPAWFAWKFGSPEYLGVVNTYIDKGCNGGSPPYHDIADLRNWTGGAAGRATHQVRKYPPVADGPARVTNLSARAVSGKVEISFTTPASAKRVHVVYATVPVSASYTKDASKRNPWGSTAVPNTLVCTPGTTQSLQFGGAPSGKTIYVAVIMFDAQGHMSPLSNVATVTAP